MAASSAPEISERQRFDGCGAAIGGSTSPRSDLKQAKGFFCLASPARPDRNEGASSGSARRLLSGILSLWVQAMQLQGEVGRCSLLTHLKLVMLAVRTVRRFEVDVQYQMHQMHQMQRRKINSAAPITSTSPSQLPEKHLAALHSSDFPGNELCQIGARSSSRPPEQAPEA